MPPFDTIVLAVAAILFVIALGSLVVWAFKTFVTGQPSARGFLRPRDKRLGVVETAAVDARRKLLLVRRDDVEHLIIVGGPVDMVIETGIKGRAASRAPARGRHHRQERDEAGARFRQKIESVMAFLIDCGRNTTGGFPCGDRQIEVNKESELMAALCCWGSGEKTPVISSLVP